MWRKLTVSPFLTNWINKILLLRVFRGIVRFKNGIELRVFQFWSAIILVISNLTRAGRSFDFKIHNNNHFILHDTKNIIQQKNTLNLNKQKKKYSK